jgi:hypothetical protein
MAYSVVVLTSSLGDAAIEALLYRFTLANHVNEPDEAS